MDSTWLCLQISNQLNSHKMHRIRPIEYSKTPKLPILKFPSKPYIYIYIYISKRKTLPLNSDTLCHGPRKNTFSKYGATSLTGTHRTVSGLYNLGLEALSCSKCSRSNLTETERSRPFNKKKEFCFLRFQCKLFNAVLETSRMYQYNMLFHVFFRGEVGMFHVHVINSYHTWWHHSH